MCQKRLIRNLLVAFAFLFILASCSVHSNNNTLHGLRKNQSRGYFTQIKGSGADSFTLMIYMNGGEAEENYGKATKAIDAMRQADISDKLTVIIETGGVQTWQNDFLSGEGSDRILLNSKGFSILSGTKLSSEMNDAAKLSDFVEKTKLEFPADRYGLIFWGDTALEANEISQVLSEQALDFIGLDAPRKTSFELAYLLEPCADYLIGQAGNLAIGWDYAALITQISENTSIATTDIAKGVSSNIKSNAAYTVTGSSPGVYCADLTEAKHVAKTILSTYTGLTDLILQGNFAQVAALRNAAAYDNKNVYINAFAKNATVENALDMQTAVSSMLRFKDSDTQSLTVYFPTGDFPQIAQELGVYEANGLGYSPFVSTYMSVCLGMQLYANPNASAPQVSASAPAAPPSQTTDVPPSASTPATDEYTPVPTATQQYDWYIPDVAKSYADLYAKGAQLPSKPELSATENLLSLSGSSDILQSASIETYLQVDGQNLALGTAEMLQENGVYQKPFSDEWLSINGQTTAWQALSSDEQGYLLCPVLLGGKPAHLLLAQNASEGTYEVVGLLLEQGPYVEFYELQKGDVLAFRFAQHNQALTYIHDTTHGIILTVADKLTATTAYVSGDIYVRAITQDIFGNIYEGDILDLRLLLTQTPADAGTASPPAE